MAAERILRNFADQGCGIMLCSKNHSFMQRLSHSYDMLYEISSRIEKEVRMRRLNEREDRNKVDEVLYSCYAPLLLTYLCHQVSNEQDARDLLLEVFIAALDSRTFSDLAAEQQLPWLRLVAKNKVIDRHRHTALITFMPLEQVMEITDDRLSPEQHVEEQENYHHLYQALAHLSSLQRELILLRYSRGLRLVEIAHLLQKPEGTVRSLLTRTLRQLRTLYDKIEGGK